MMKMLARNWSRLVVVFLGLAILATGCRKPKLDLSGLREMPGGMSAPVGGVPFEPVNDGGATPGGPGGWQDPNNPIDTGAGGKGTIEPITARWSNVVIYFAYDSAAIGPAERPKLDTLSRHLKEHPDYSVIIEGHCDERGSDEYNRALGESRALVVRDYLISLGIDAGRLETISYGEERPVVPNAQTEAEHQKNRRVEFVIGVRK